MPLIRLMAASRASMVLLSSTMFWPLPVMQQWMQTVRPSTVLSGMWNLSFLQAWHLNFFMCFLMGSLSSPTGAVRSNVVKWCMLFPLKIFYVVVFFAHFDYICNTE